LVVVGDVAGGLLEVGGQPSPLDPLGQQVRDVLERHVRAAELGHRVVAVLREHPLVELLGAGGRVLAPQVVGELVEEQLLEALRRARVAGEQRPLDHLGQAGEREHVVVGCRDVPSEQLAVLVGDDQLDELADARRPGVEPVGSEQLGPQHATVETDRGDT
jgi:hypothetical protein